MDFWADEDPRQGGSFKSIADDDETNRDGVNVDVGRFWALVRFTTAAGESAAAVAAAAFVLFTFGVLRLDMLMNGKCVALTLLLCVVWHPN